MGRGRRFSQFPPREPSSGFTRSLQHDIFEVLLQDGVLDGVEDKADILRVYGGGEVVEERLAPVSPLTAERLHQERLEGPRREKDSHTDELMHLKSKV